MHFVTAQRFRVWFRKGERVRYISHLDVLRSWERSLRRAELPLDIGQKLEALGLDERRQGLGIAPAHAYNQVFDFVGHSRSGQWPVFSGQFTTAAGPVCTDN